MRPPSPRRAQGWTPASSDDRGWVVAQGPGPLCAQTQMFPETKPGWFEELPKKNGWTFAHGVSALSYKDEAGSWEVATYRALVELAVDRSARLGSLERSTTGAVEGAMRVQVEAELVGEHDLLDVFFICLRRRGVGPEAVGKNAEFHISSSKFSHTGCMQ